jgi:hypothetical protein
LLSVEHWVWDETPIQGRELTSVGYSESEEVTIRDLAGVEHAAEVDFLAVQEADVVGPEFVARQTSKTFQ